MVKMWTSGDWPMYDRSAEHASEERLRGKSVGLEQAYSEGYKAKYEQWVSRLNPYAEGTIEADGFDEGYAEAVTFTL